MVVTKEVYEIDGGYGYKISIDDKLFINQPHAPAVSGFVKMTEGQANALADKVVQKINSQAHPALSIQEVNEVINGG